jgi:SAM-dependent methyltransferase
LAIALQWYVRRVAKDPLAGSTWSGAATVAGFARAAPNQVLMRYAHERQREGGTRLLDLGCGAGRNAVPLAREGWDVLGTDLSWPMLSAAADRSRTEGLQRRLQVALAPMDVVPAGDRSFDLVVAHGIWNLAGSARELRRAVAEAARVARPAAGLFVFTFSRNTLPPATQPIAGETFVFTEFSGQPQCFLTARELFAELDAAGFVPDPAVPFTEYNRPLPGALHTVGPVIYEAAFRRGH